MRFFADAPSFFLLFGDLFYEGMGIVLGLQQGEFKQEESATAKAFSLLTSSLSLFLPLMASQSRRKTLWT